MLEASAAKPEAWVSCQLKQSAVGATQEPQIESVAKPYKG